MGTRSLIVLEDGYNAMGIYCGCDGYHTGVGISLVIGYTKADMARHLVKVVSYGHGEAMDETPCATEEQCRDYINNTEFCHELEAA